MVVNHRIRNLHDGNRPFTDANAIQPSQSLHTAAIRIAMVSECHATACTLLCALSCCFSLSTVYCAALSHKLCSSDIHAHTHTDTHITARSVPSLSRMLSLSSTPSTSPALSMSQPPLPDVTPSTSSVSAIPDTDASMPPAKRWFKVGTGSNSNYMICTFKNCGTHIKVQSRGQTSNQLEHLRTTHKMNIPRRQPNSSSSPTSAQSQSSPKATQLLTYLIPSTSTDTTSATRRPPTKEQRQQWTLVLLQMAVEMNVSFRSLCECEVFRRFLFEQLSWTVPSRMTLQRLLPTYHAHLVSVLREELQTVDALCITTDSTFLTRHQVPYICITGHWIDKQWQLHDEVLAVFLAEQSETAEFISTRLKDTLENQLGVNRKLHCITTDEGQNFLAAVDILKTSNTIRESVRCACHRLQLVMKNAYNHEECASLKALLDRCSTLVNVFKNGWASTKRDILSRYQKQHIEQLQKEILQLKTEAAHGTRAVAEALQMKSNMLQDTLRLLNDDNSEIQSRQAENVALAKELSDVCAIDESEQLLQQLHEVEDGIEVNDESKDNESTSRDEETEQLLFNASKKLEDARYLTSFTDYIFNKRALIQKAATRWLTYVKVVERCIIWHKPLTNALNDIKNNSSASRQRDVEWDNLKITDDECNLLTQFLIVGRACKQVIESLEGSKHTTIGSLLWHHHRLRAYLSELIRQNEVDLKISAFCNRILENSKIKFTADVDKAAMISLLLDPRYKELSFLSQAEGGKCVDALRHAFTDLEIELGEFDSLITVAVPGSRKRKINKPNMWTDFTGDVLNAASPNKGKAVQRTEIERYLAHPQESDRFVDPLQWWKLYESKFPKVSILARRYLAIPASSAASERLFSRLKQTATAARQGLKPSTLCMLLFVEKHQKRLMSN